MAPSEPLRDHAVELDLTAFGSPALGGPLDRDGPEIVAPSNRRYPVAHGFIPIFSDDTAPWIDADEHQIYSDHADGVGPGHIAVVDDRRFIEDLVRQAEQGQLPSFGGGPWLDAVYDVLAQEACYTYVGDLAGKSVLQIGGKGFHAAKAIIAGASEVYLVTPVLAEARYFVETARIASSVNPTCDIHIAVGVAEELPLPSQRVDVVLSGGCLHHTDVPVALTQAHRVLKSGGRFGGWDPFRSLLYRMGTGILGKREPGVNCRPIDAERLRLVPVGTRVQLYSPLARYVLLAAFKAGFRISLGRSHSIQSLEERLLSRFRWADRLSSSVAITFERIN